MRPLLLSVLALAVAACQPTAQCTGPACTTPEVSAFEDVPWVLDTFDVSVCVGTTCDALAVPRDGSMVPLPNVGGWVSIGPQPAGAGSRVTVTLFDGGDGGSALRVGDTVHVTVKDSSPPHDLICDMTGTVIAASGTCACGPLALSGFVDN